MPLTSSPDIVLLDLDGTITDSYPGILRCLTLALPSIDLGHLTENQIRAFLGPPLHYTLGEVYGKTKEEIDAFVVVYRSHYFGGGEYEFEVFPGMAELIVDLGNSDIKLGLATAKPIPSAERVLTKAGLIEHFDFVGGSDMDLTRQDKPSILSFTIENIGGTITDGNNANIVMVGDRKEDIIGAKHHRFTSIGAAWGYADANELQDAEPDHIVSNADALRAILLPE